MLAAVKPLLLLSLFLIINVEACPRPADAPSACPGQDEPLERCCPEIEPLYRFKLFFNVFIKDPQCPNTFQATFKLFTQSTRSGVSISRDNVPPEFSNNRPTVLIVHGLGESFNSRYQTMKEALLTKADYNVISVEWQNGAKWVDALQSVPNIETMNRYLGSLVNSLRKQPGANAYFWCIGHGAGAHICGKKNIQDYPPLDRITGVDPLNLHGGHGLSKDNALRVDVIHTDSEIGVTEQQGHVDFYPNGGKSQPGCPAVNPVVTDTTAADRQQAIDSGGSATCSHGRALEYMIHSINSPLCYVATHRCRDNNNIPSLCDRIPSNEQKSYMGHDAIHYRYEGILYYKADNTSPYCSLP